MSYKAIAVIRTSTIAQEIESQKEQVLDMCFKDGLKEDEIIIVGEQGASAIKLDESYLKNLNQVYNLINETPTIKTVYSWAIDRLGRNEEVLMKLKNTLINKKIQLVIKNPSLRLLNDDGSVNAGIELAFALFATMSKQEMEQKKARFARARERDRKAGKFLGGPQKLFGYEVDENGFYVPHREEAPIVKEIFDEYSTGKWSIRKLLVEMTNRGYLRFGKKIPLTTFKMILYNGAKYCGEDEIVNLPPILSKEIVEKVNQILSKNKSLQKSKHHTYFASSLIKCKCGKTLQTINKYYRCGSNSGERHLRAVDIQKCDDNNYIKTATLDGILWKVARECHETVMTQMNKERKKEYNKQIKILDKKIEKFQKDLDSFKVKRKRLTESYILEDLTEEDMTRLRNKIEAQEKQVNSQLEEFQNQKRRLESALNMGENKKKDNELNFLTSMDLMFHATETEMNDLVRKYILTGVVMKYEGEELEGRKGWKCIEIDLDTIFGERRFIYFPNGTKHKLYEYVDNEWIEFYAERIERDKEGYKLEFK